MGFRAIVVDKDADGRTHAAVREIGLEDLPEGEVTVAVEYSTLNYKDGLCLGPGAGLVRKYPHVPGVDFAGRVEASSDPRYQPGDAVVLTGWRVGEAHWGGYAQKARVKADWLVPLPEGLTLARSMAIGTAGLTAMLAVMALEEQGLRPGQGPVLVTGAAGGVGSVAVALLATAGYDVVAVTGRPETAAYLTELGATRILPRDEIAEPIARPLESESWAGAVDCVGGAMLSRVTKQLKYGASVACLGNAGGLDVPLSVIPLLLRGIRLIGIDSVLKPFDARQRAWERIVQDLDMEKLDAMTRRVGLAEVPALGAEILRGGVRGRILVDVAA
ncbi:acrylyl-CoA reductase (NADPH) [Amaricoccus macauensis]|uniref:Acrylyl-CoA reductase (NADPH) n=1 Tax=Amaricoccus macauensis TaxID=57001 RepID=A0A840SND3_9RHOB|nr:MDR family oxidoreductase [Amaricoccus macauensis]MBB5222270.1 acrylyl-CoA reductase (NADPH) [Amaricoccus macauensis]